VITATSPRLERTSNWEATLWHEFCHTVTLDLTNNKMPRWLSEGISVYEELQQDPTWGQRMTPTYRRMILEGEMKPVGELSTAFMSPPSPVHLQFAYYQSALVVEFLVDSYGFNALRAILVDLGHGVHINAAREKHAGRLARIERDFEAFARKRAEALAPEADWEQPEPDQATNWQAWLAERPNSYWALTMQAKSLMAQERWDQAKAPLEKLISLYPGDTEGDNAYRMLAEVHRNLSETDKELEVLQTWAVQSADAVTAFGRLMEIGTECEQWDMVVANGQRYLAVFPMLAPTHRLMGRAHEALGNAAQAVDAYRSLLQLGPADPVDVHYRLARLLHEQNPQSARRHILEALADAPRFRDGHRLLLDLAETPQ
jgi:tetratricopeptide (TPR) repeat protein